MKFEKLKKHKRFLAGAFVLLTVLSFAFAPQLASQAQAGGTLATTAPTNTTTPSCSGFQGLIIIFTSGFGYNPRTCSFSASNVVCAVVGTCLTIVRLILLPLQLTSWILGISGNLLDASIQYTIVDITTHINALLGISIAWSVIRDLINFSFIFILLYAGVQMILNGGGNMKKLIPIIVIAAILINFSLFFAKVIIDASNAVTLQLYSSIVTGCNEDVTQLGSSSLSACFSAKLGVTTLFSAAGAASGSNTNSSSLLDSLQNDFGKAAVISIGGSIFLLITTFVFLSVAIMLLVRFVVIVILFIFSPLMVIGGVLPGVGKYTNQWWGEMTDQAVFPAIFMLMVWVILRIMSGANFLQIVATNPDGTPVTAATVLNDGGTVNVVANFVIIIAFMITALTVSKSFSKHGGKLATETAGKIMGGGAGYIGRRTIGAASRGLADNEKLKQKASEKGFGGSMARLALRGGQKGAKASYDARGTMLGKKLDAGKATGKGGYDAYLKDKVKEQTDFANSLKPSDVAIDEAKQESKSAEEALKIARRDGKPEEEIRAAQERFDKAKKRADKLTGNKEEVEKNVKNLEEERKKKVDDAKNNSDAAKELKKATDDLEKAIINQRSSQDVYNRLQVEADAATGEGKAEKVIQVQIAKSQFEDAKTLADNARTRKNTADEKVKRANSEIESAMKAEYDKKKEEAKAREIKSAGDRRKEGYADVLAGEDGYNPFLGTNWAPGDKRVLKFGMIKRQNKVAAANIRGTGGKKRVEDMVKDAMKANEEVKEDKKEDGEDSTGGAPTEGGPPSPAAGTPPTP